MNPSDSSRQGEDEENEAPVKAKRSKADHAGGEVVYHPVKLSRNDLYRPPTAEELNQLKEAESLFHCSLLKMQVRRQTYDITIKDNDKKRSVIISLNPVVVCNH